MFNEPASSSCFQTHCERAKAQPRSAWQTRRVCLLPASRLDQRLLVVQVAGSLPPSVPALPGCITGDANCWIDKPCKVARACVQKKRRSERAMNHQSNGQFLQARPRSERAMNHQSNGHQRLPAGEDRPVHLSRVVGTAGSLPPSVPAWPCCIIRESSCWTDRPCNVAPNAEKRDLALRQR